MNTELQKCIIDKATQLFYKFGIKSITMDFIAKELGISKRTLYENFKNKDSLIIACMDVTQAAYCNKFEAIAQSDDNTVEKLMRYYGIIEDFYRNTSRSFQLDIERMHTQANAEYEASRERTSKYMAQLLRNGVAEGLIRDDIDIDIVVSVYNKQMDGYRRMQDLSELEYNMSDILSNIVIIFIRGIATEEGYRVLDRVLKEKPIKKY